MENENNVPAENNNQEPETKGPIIGVIIIVIILALAGIYVFSTRVSPEPEHVPLEEEYIDEQQAEEDEWLRRIERDMFDSVDIIDEDEEEIIDEEIDEDVVEDEEIDEDVVEDAEILQD